MYEQLAGKYIVIEGTDGAGTTTQKNMLLEQIDYAKQDALGVAEPGGTEIGDRLRIISKDALLERSPETNVDINTICRRELMRQIIRPALESGTHVVSDRNWFSTIAYQGFGEKFDLGKIVDLSTDALGEHLIPDFSVIVDIPTEVAEERMQRRGSSGNDFFEQKTRDFFDKVREGYLWVADEYDIPVVDGTESKENVNKAIISKMGNLAVTIGANNVTNRT